MNATHGTLHHHEEHVKNLQDQITYYEYLSKQWTDYISQQQTMAKAWEDYVAKLKLETEDIKKQWKGPLLPPGVDHESASVKEAWIRYHKAQLNLLTKK